MDDINDSQRVQIGSSGHNSKPISSRLAYEGDFEAFSLIDGGDEDSDWFDLGIVDVEAETESKRQEAEARLRTKSNELKRFHDKICMRVTERER
ncbi:Peptidase P60 [Phytophthora cinnamomi]|nr:Peptidase P60 [Phytophthora cinnamomi]